MNPFMDPKITKWKKYKWLVAKIYHSDLNSTKLKVEYNRRVRGKISGRLRQCDILIKNRETNNLSLIDAKDRKNKVDIKTVEEFEGLCKDIDASIGLIISSKGFTVGAKRRAKGTTNIFLDEVDWQLASEALQGVELSNYIPEVCPQCDSGQVGVAFPGLILWDVPLGKIQNGILYSFWIGECLKCKQKYLYCDSCGMVSEIHGSRISCSICHEEYCMIGELPP